MASQTLSIIRRSLATFLLFAVVAAPGGVVSAADIRRAPIVPVNSRYSDLLNAAADRIMHTTVLQTVGAIKPFSVVGKGEYQDLRYNIVDDIELLREDGALKNPDLLFFRSHTATPVLPDNDMVVVSRSGIERLLRDRTVAGMLEKYKDAIPCDAPKSVEDWVSLYKVAVDAGGYAYNGPVWGNIVIGIALGYPPIESEMYAVNQEGSDLQRKLIMPELQGFRFSGYMRFSGFQKERDAYYVGATYVLAENYMKLASSGIAPVELINAPEKLAHGAPAFPLDLLVGEPALSAAHK